MEQSRQDLTIKDNVQENLARLEWDHAQNHGSAATKLGKPLRSTSPVPIPRPVSRVAQSWLAGASSVISFKRRYVVVWCPR